MQTVLWWGWEGKAMTSPVVLEAETCLWPERCSSPIATSGSSLRAFKCLGPFHRSFHFDLEYSALLLSRADRTSTDFFVFLGLKATGICLNLPVLKVLILPLQQ